MQPRCGPAALRSTALAAHVEDYAALARWYAGLLAWTEGAFPELLGIVLYHLPTESPTLAALESAASSVGRSWHCCRVWS